jgi:phenylacetate-CoA ligase
MRFAADTIPYYHELSKSMQGDLEGLRELGDLPVVTKRGVISDRAAFLNPNADLSKAWRNNTSGSTGTPSTFYFGWKSARINKALYRFSMFESGMRPWHRMARDYTTSPKPTRWYESFGFMRTRCYSTFEQGSVTARKMAEWGPHVLYLTPSHLQLLCYGALEEGVALSADIVMTQGETLFESQRKTIVDTLQADVHDQYGSAEFPRIAWECEEGNYHILPEQIVEVLDEEGEPVSPGERGRITCTQLHNTVMPLMRYDMGDLAVRGNEEPCNCGRRLPTLESIEGRDDSFIVNKRGERISPRVLDGSLSRNPEIRLYEAYQSREGQLLLRLALKDPAKDPSSLTGVSALRKGFGDSVDLTVEVVDDLPLQGSGKRRIMTSTLPASRVNA